MSVILHDVEMALGGRTVLQLERLALEPGRLTVVVGPNGAGKSTLMRVASGELQPSRGYVSVNGRPLAKWPAADLARARAVLPQSTQLAFPFTVFEVVSLGLTAAARSLSGARRRAHVAHALARAGLAGYGGRFYQELSGGEQQRVQFARVLCQLPDAGDPETPDICLPAWLMLDEPTASLDLRHQFAILDEARDHVRAGGGALAILHDLNLASVYADRLIVLSEGRVSGDGEPGAVLSQELVEEVFGVRLRLTEGERGRRFVLPERLARDARI